MGVANAGEKTGLRKKTAQSTYYGDVVSLHTSDAFAVEESQLNDNGIIPEPLIDTWRRAF